MAPTGRQSGTNDGRRASEAHVTASPRLHDAASRPAPRRRALGAAALAVLLLAGCAGSSGDDATATTATTLAPAGTSVTTAPAETTTSEAPTTTSTTVPPTTTTTTAPVDPTTVPEPAGPLQSGSKGTRTKALQTALAAQKYAPGEADGAFGLKTTLAIWALPALNGLPQDGVVTPELEAKILAAPAQAMLRPELGPTHTEVDLTRQVMVVWRDGAPTLITHVSTGSEVGYCEDTDTGQNCGDAITPTGVFTFERRIEGWREAPLGRLYNPVYFHQGIAVHGASSVPDHPASHGCVRIPMDIAEYFPSLVQNGDRIEVFRS